MASRSYLCKNSALSAKTSALWNEETNGWEDRECPVCMRDPGDPNNNDGGNFTEQDLIKLSGCNHGVCREDLRTIVRGGGALRCPLCREPFDNPFLDGENPLPRILPRLNLEGHYEFIMAVAIQGDTIVSGSRDRPVKVWQLPIENQQRRPITLDEIEDQIGQVSM